MNRIITLIILLSCASAAAEYGSNQGSFGQPESAAAVTGKVYTPQGTPIAGAIIRGPFGLRTLTAADGSYQLPIDVPGRYTISISTGTVETQQTINLAPGATATLNVGLVPGTPVLGAAPTSLAFVTNTGTLAASQTLTISNTGGGSLNYTLSGNAAWIKASPTSGSGGSHGVAADCTGLNAGSYTGTLTVNDATAANSPLVVTVSLDCLAPSGSGNNGGGGTNGGGGGGGGTDGSNGGNNGGSGNTGGATEPTTDSSNTGVTSAVTAPVTASKAVSGGCGCTISGGSTLGEIWFYVLLLGLWIALRRRVGSTGEIPK